MKIDPAAEFLLDLHWSNLFERVSAAPGGDVGFQRCKGCGEVVPASKMERHHAAHIHTREQWKAKRAEQNRREAAERLARARAMRGQPKGDAA